MTHKIILLFSLFVLFFQSQNALSQNNIFKEHFEIALRGKALLAPIPPSSVFANTATIGAEFIYKKRHSLGIDISYWKWILQFRNTQDSNYVVYVQYEARSFLYIDYKYKISEGEDLSWYLNVYSKLGKEKMWYSDLRTENDSSQLALEFRDTTLTGRFSEIGLGVGFKHYGYRHPRIGVDFSFNIAARNGVNNEMAIRSTGMKWREGKTIYFLPYFKLNFFYIIKHNPVINNCFTFY
ncbi:MAG: hypothetical protein HRT71_06110 [Flavobacteriales bacterium]|nr:hypothetical protein [Flavobacteriales bacterium]